MSKIYTKTGDEGETGLIGGRRVGKDDALIGVFGELDELSAVLGMCRAEIGLGADESDVFGALNRLLFFLQGDLLIMGAVLAGSSGLRKLDVEKLEKEIDKVSDKLPELTNFILPGGRRLGAQLHFARAVCRRGERALVRVKKNENTKEETVTEFVAYLNRLSDLLFVLARWVNMVSGVEDEKWGN